METDPVPSLNRLGGFEPVPTAKNVGLLKDRDDVTGGRSRFMAGAQQKPKFLWFEVDVKENGKTSTYSDDPARGKACVFSGSGRTAVNLFLQGTRFAGGPISGTKTLWVRRAADLNDPRFWRKGAPQGVRWTLVMDKSRLPAPTKIEVLSIRIYYQ